ncbi:MAG: dipeptidase [Bacteroidales bacterium]|nr:dipeptidase [Candidatus Cryptobacteroides equifaecalis]
MILDAHCDAPSQMLRLRDYALDNDHAQVDFPKMRRGGVDASFFALYIPASLKGNDATAYARKLLSVLKAQLAASSDEAALATSAAEVLKNKEEGRLSVLVGMENASAIQEDFSLLEEFYKEGVRYVTLTHSADNQVGDSCTGSGLWGGLSPFGKKLVREMDSMGMLVDLAHASEDTMRDVLDISVRPVLDTHCCCKALCKHRRNISDELLRGIAEGGGVVGMSIYPLFLSDSFATIYKASGLSSESWIEDEFIADPSDPERRLSWYGLLDRLSALKRPGVDVVADHVMHAIEVAGEDHVGFGTDYDGIEFTASGMETIADFHVLLDELKARGMGEKSLKKLSWENFLRLL